MNSLLLSVAIPIIIISLCFDFFTVCDIVVDSVKEFFALMKDTALKLETEDFRFLIGEENSFSYVFMFADRLCIRL